MGLAMTDIYGGFGGVRVAESEPVSERMAPDASLLYPNTPAISWIGILLVLIALRVLYELAEEM